ncbi:MAG TPA: J domain-containing protein [Ktedonobacterales bacterium]|nr:J domain-containing protein [Ktedonobacterales bacterium]
MADEPDYYAVLELASDADDDEIRQAFRRLARLYHPDVAGTGDLAHMQRLNIAYQALSDPARRAEYDLTRARHGADQPRAAAAAHTPRGARTARGRAGMVRATAGPLTQRHRLDANATSVAALTFAQAGARLAAGTLDGHVLLWDVAHEAAPLPAVLSLGSGAGILQEVRLAPSGRLVMAWGLALGLRVWRVEGGQALWSTAINGPSGTLDATLLDAPARARLALPDAPLALAADDPFRWAHEGRAGTAIFTRPLEGPVNALTPPARCPEIDDAPRRSSGANAGWRVHQRLLSADGTRLLTYAGAAGAGQLRFGALRLWELDHQALLGGQRPRQGLRIPLPAALSHDPLVATPDLAWIGTAVRGNALRLVQPAERTERIVITGPMAADARAALAPDGALLALARGATLDLWRTVDGHPLQQWEFGAEITALAFAAGAPALLGVGLANGVVELWG